MLDLLIELIREKKIFKRNKKKEEEKAIGVLLYHLALSYRATSKILREKGRGEESHEAVRSWYIRSREIFEVEREGWRGIAIDETEDGKARGGTDIRLDSGLGMKKKKMFLEHMSLARGREVV